MKLFCLNFQQTNTAIYISYFACKIANLGACRIETTQRNLEQ